MASLQSQQLCRCSSLRTPAPTGSEASARPSTLRFGASTFASGRLALPAVSGHVQVSELARLVIEAKGRKNPIPRSGQNATSTRMAPRIPDFDPADQTPYFTMFVRGKAKTGVRGLNVWLPLTIVAGGSTASPLIQLMSSPFGKKLYQGTLTKNMAMSVTKDGATMIKRAKEVYPELSDYAEYDFGYKILDKKNPKTGFNTSDVTLIPAEKDMKSVIDKVRDFANKFLPSST